MEVLDSEPCTENQLRVFYAKDTFQFFNSRDVTLLNCGYDHRDRGLSVLEKQLLSFIRVELENVLPSLLFACHPHSISNCKSFTSFLLRNICVSSDVACVNVCYDTIEAILTMHPHSKSISFCSSDIFMILFNYGIDVKSFHLLKCIPDVERQLLEPTSQGKYSKIPKNWAYNVKTILRTLTTLVSVCGMQSQDLSDIVLFLLWMSLDPVVHKENLYSILQDSISKCVEKLVDNENLIYLAKVLVLVEFPNPSEKWKAVYSMTESVPNTTKKCNYLRQQISFLVLNHLCHGAIRNTDSLEFSVKKFTELLQEITNLKSENILSVAAKYVDLCSGLNMVPEISSFKKSCVYSKFTIKVKEEKDIKSKVESSFKIKTEEDSSYIDIKSGKKGAFKDPISVVKSECSEKVIIENSASADEKLVSDHPDPSLVSMVESQTNNDLAYVYSCVDQNDYANSVREASHSNSETLNIVIKKEVPSCSIADSNFKDYGTIAGFSSNDVGLIPENNELNLFTIPDFNQNIKTIECDQITLPVCSITGATRDATVSDTMCQVLSTDVSVDDVNCNLTCEDISDPMSSVKIVSVESFAFDVHNPFDAVKKSLSESKLTLLRQNLLNGALSQSYKTQLPEPNSIDSSTSVSDAGSPDGSMPDLASGKESVCSSKTNQTTEKTNDENINMVPLCDELPSKAPDHNTAPAKRKSMSDFSNMSLKFQRIPSADGEKVVRKKLGKIENSPSLSRCDPIALESKENIVSLKSKISDRNVTDPDIQLLYIDSRNYIDEECIITYESKGFIVLD